MKNIYIDEKVILSNRSKTPPWEDKIEEKSLIEKILFIYEK